MASERRSRRVLAAASAASTSVAVLATLSVATPVAAADPWWKPVGLRGTPVIALVADGNNIDVRTSTGATLHSADGGASFAAAGELLPAAPPSAVQSGSDSWRIDATGHVLHGTGRGPLGPDP